VIGKISARGRRVAGLLYYLYGPGRSEAHTDPHLVAGWRDPAELEAALRQDKRRDLRRLAGLLQQPHAALGPRGFERPVWHCSIRTAPQDRVLSDSQWAQAARDARDAEQAEAARNEGGKTCGCDYDTCRSGELPSALQAPGRPEPEPEPELEAAG
jgi:hypothetical protein